MKYVLTIDYFITDKPGIERVEYKDITKEEILKIVADYIDRDTNTQITWIPIK